MQPINEIIKIPEKKPLSERSYWISQIEELLQIPRRALIFKWLNHIPAGEKGTDILRCIYLDSLKTEEKSRKFKCWELIKKSK